MFLLFVVSLMHSCSGKKLFCAFIDYKQAFESVQRGLLLDKRVTDYGGSKSSFSSSACNGRSSASR